MLEFDRFIPDDVTDGAPLIVLLHGRGADKNDLAALRPRLPDEALLVLPRAPFPAAPWGYGPGWAWYRFLGGDRPEPETFEESQTELRAFLDALPDTLRDRYGIDPGPLVLGGFSQGGTMSMAQALRSPGDVPLVLNFSGFIADHPNVAVAPETVRGTRFFWGHGTRDPNIPITLAQRGREALRSAGADVEARDYPIGHWIDPGELDDAVTWLRDGLERRRGADRS